MKQHRPVVLASGSKARKDLLSSARISFDVHVPNVDEGSEKLKLSQSAADAPEIARHLAALKATTVSRRHAGVPTIGADQTLSCGGRQFDKPGDMTEAHEHLSFMTGKTHTLHSAVIVACDGRVLWEHQAEAHLKMRHLTDNDIRAYIEMAGTDILTSVGCYRLEDTGPRLFEAIDGDYFTILGLPLLPVLSCLRDLGAIDL